MSKTLLVDALYPEETRVAVLERKKLIDYDYEISNKPQLKGNVYLAKIIKVEASLQAAFIEYGKGKNGFLPFSEIHPNYFNIPVQDQQEKEEKITIENNFKEITPPNLEKEEVDKNFANHKKDSNNKDENIDSSIVDNKDIAELSPEDENLVDENDILENKKDDNRELYKKYKIQEVIKKNQVMLVQVVKEERGNKGVSLTSYLSLAGKYCVLMPNADRQGGVSRRVTDSEQRKRLKNLIDELNIPEGISVIIRTAGEDHTNAEIKRDYDYLARLWNSIRESTIKTTAPCFIHAESDIIKRAIRDIYDSSTKDVFVSGEHAYKRIIDFTKKIFPGNEKKIKFYSNNKPIFHKFGIEREISKFFSTTAELASGGYLVINPTEALTSIDVNSGKSTSERNVEETAYKTNIEAAKEVAKQVKLRDISGLIVIDFIDMEDPNHKRNIERILKDGFKSDRARVHIASISNFGLVEMSRQRIRSSFSETHLSDCNVCNGKGKVKDLESSSINIFRTIENEISRGKPQKAIIYSHSKIILYILNYKRDHINRVENKFSTKLDFRIDQTIESDNYSIEIIDSLESSDELLTPSVTEDSIKIEDLKSYMSPEEQKSFHKSNRNTRDYSSSGEKRYNKSRSKKNRYNKNNKKNSHNQKSTTVEKSWWQKIFD